MSLKRSCTPFRDVIRRYSAASHAAGLSMLTTWALIPDLFKSQINVKWGAALLGVVFGFGLLGSFLDQPGTRVPPSEPSQ